MVFQLFFSMPCKIEEIYQSNTSFSHFLRAKNATMSYIVVIKKKYVKWGRFKKTKKIVAIESVMRFIIIAAKYNLNLPE